MKNLELAPERPSLSPELAPGDKTRLSFYEKFAEEGWIFFKIASNEHDLIALVKMKPGRHWHTERKLWSVPDTPENRVKIKEIHQMPPLKGAAGGGR